MTTVQIVILCFILTNLLWSLVILAYTHHARGKQLARSENNRDQDAPLKTGVAIQVDFAKNRNKSEGSGPGAA